MPSLRYKTVRKVAHFRSTTDEEKVRVLRALYIMVYNAEESLIPYSVELFHTLGDILEGIPPEELDLHRIDKQKFLHELQEL